MHQWIVCIFLRLLNSVEKVASIFRKQQLFSNTFEQLILILLLLFEQMHYY